MTEEELSSIDIYISQIVDSFTALEVAYKNCSSIDSTDMVSIIGCAERSGMRAVNELEVLLYKIKK